MIATTPRMPPQIKTHDPHKDRMPRIREAMDKPVRSVGGVMAGIGAGGAGGFGGTGEMGGGGGSVGAPPGGGFSIIMTSKINNG